MVGRAVNSYLAELHVPKWNNACQTWQKNLVCGTAYNPTEHFSKKPPIGLANYIKSVDQQTFLALKLLVVGRGWGNIIIPNGPFLLLPPVSLAKHKK